LKRKIENNRYIQEIAQANNGLNSGLIDFITSTLSNPQITPKSADFIVFEKEIKVEEPPASK
jgi:hypothetical protein